ncbi:putative protein with domain of unknown function (DUF4139) [Lyophyllum shimeji]|uniref:DUF4139 domain-containing protein n=1 Tax=Lyophyllum shimeji TaxID=47721 RepID=A0A9P3Q085_LYOSH|nr:putative protein with domain of unknown function (DUF4139) [Lyophyllum shimeji]
MHVSPALKINAQDHSIKSVTVFKSSKAEIVRHFSLDLATAQNKVEIHGLPSTLDTHSVRVSNLPAGVRLFDVVCTIGTSKDASYARDSPSERVRLLTVKRQALESERRVREHEADLLVNYAKTLTGEHVAPEKMSSFLESFVQQGRKNLQAITELGEKIVDIDRQIEKEAEQSAQKKGEARGEVSIVLGADEPTSIDLRLTYSTSPPSPSLTPSDSLNFSREQRLLATHVRTTRPHRLRHRQTLPTLSLHYRALVTQSTGEDWAGTLLTLSTMSFDTTARKIPQLKPVKLLPRPAFHSNRDAFNTRGAVGIFGTNNNNNNNAARQAGAQFAQYVMGGGAGGLFGQGGAAFGQAQQQVQPQHNPTTAVAGCAPQVQAQAPVFGAPSVPAPRTTGFSAFGAPASAATTSTTVPAQSQGQSQSAFGGFFGSAPATVASSGTAADDGFEEIAVPGSDSGLAAGDGDGAGGGAGAEPTTFVHETPVAISFSIVGKTSIPSDGAEHQVEVAVCEFAGVVSYVCVPRLDARVYLQCEVKNTSEYRLLAGPVSVILDDSYVSKTSIQDVSTNDTFTCTLGTDPATLVSYTRASRTAKDEARGAFAEPRNTTTYTTTITLRNKHAFGLEEVLVRDVVPTCDDKLPRVRVVLRKPAGLADAKDGESVSVDVSAGDGTGKATVQWEKGDGARGAARRRACSRGAWGWGRVRRCCWRRSGR